MIINHNITNGRAIKFINCVQDEFDEFADLGISITNVIDNDPDDLNVTFVCEFDELPLVELQLQYISGCAVWKVSVDISCCPETKVVNKLPIKNDADTFHYIHNLLNGLDY